MPQHVGRKAIDRAAASLAPGGALELGFFGGEPLLEAGFVHAMVEHARYRAESHGAKLSLAMTTNGTVTTPAAWSLMMLPEMHLAVSHDGLPAVHNRYRRLRDGSPTSAVVLRTIGHLLEAGKDFSVVMVVRPDTVQYLPAGMLFLHGLGVRRVEPNLDLWCCWTESDAEQLRAAVEDCAHIWGAELPSFAVSWFEEKLAGMAGIPLPAAARCGFGDGEVAVAPSGHLYPCERLVRDDTDDNPMRLPGHVLDGDDFLHEPAAPCLSAEACSACAIRPACNTACRCSNYVRTGEAGMPDGLLCLFNRACAWGTAMALEEVFHGAAD
jgi:uncharacterized protein